MRCDRTDSSPCHRCQKAKRLCTLPGMTKPSYEPSPLAFVSAHLPQVSNLEPEINFQPQNLLSLNQSSQAGFLTQTPSSNSTLSPPLVDCDPSGGSDGSQSPRTLLNIQFKSPLSSISGKIDKPARGEYNLGNESQEQFLSHRDVCDLVAM